jgi:hypothetical protein
MPSPGMRSGFALPPATADSTSRPTRLARELLDFRALRLEPDRVRHASNHHQNVRVELVECPASGTRRRSSPTRNASADVLVPPMWNGNSGDPSVVVRQRTRQASGFGVNDVGLLSPAIAEDVPFREVRTASPRRRTRRCLRFGVGAARGEVRRRDAEIVLERQRFEDLHRAFLRGLREGKRLAYLLRELVVLLVVRPCPPPHPDHDGTASNWSYTSGNAISNGDRAIVTPFGSGT